MWLTPHAAGGEPAYTLVRELGAGAYELPEAGAVLHIHRLAPGAEVTLPAAHRLYLHLTAGELRLGDALLQAGDEARAGDEGGLTAEAVTGAEFLVWEFAG
jgi:redox-sensitive bicupin YhaK (pirin superfamily)